MYWIGGGLLLLLMLWFAYLAGATKGLKVGYEAGQKDAETAFYADAV